MNAPDERDIVVFTEALQLPPEDRIRYLGRACAGDSELRQRVEALLRAHDRAGRFLSEIPSEVKSQTGTGTANGEMVGDRIGNYKLLQQIGEGGCGVVFMAEQVVPVRRRVALKVVKPGMDTKNVIARFESERQALALMEHPNIAKVLDAGVTAAGRPFFVMELVRGIKITDYCDQNLLTTRGRLDLFVQVCQAVQHAHQKGIIHRDIKPSNILVTTNLEGIPMPVVIDFGIARATANQPLTDKTLFTAFEMFLGTPAYMSPEQALMTSVDIDTRSDIYSLGVLLYELLTGRTPFDATELMKAGLDEIRRVIREQDPVRPSTHLSKMTKADQNTVAQFRRSEAPLLIRLIRGDLDWIVIKAMEKDRTRRYETANGLAQDIKRFLANEPVSARSPGTFYKLHKMVLRNKLLFSGLILIVGLCVASLIIVSLSLAREREAHRDARLALRQAEVDKARAQTEAVRAQAESAKSKQVTQLLEDTLQGVGPSVALGRDTTMLREILDQTALRTALELTNQPAVEAELRSVTGRVYYEIQNYDQAEQMQRSALAISRKLYGPESLLAATSLNDLGVTLWREGKQAEAEADHQEALTIRRHLCGNESTEVAESLNNLANVYRHDKKPLLAEPLVRESLAIRQNKFGAESREAADSLRVLCILLGDEGRWTESEAIAKQVLVIRRKVLGPEHPLIASSLADLAWVEGFLGQWDDVEALQRETVAMQRKLLGENQPAFMDSLLNLCRTLEGERKFTDAEPMRREALAICCRQAGNDSPQAVDQLKALVHDFIAGQKFGDAEQVLDGALTPPFISQPASLPILELRRDLRARQGQWEKAGSDAELVVQRQPEEHFNYHVLAGLLAFSHDHHGYQEICQKIIAKFANTSDPYVAERMAQDCLLLPDSGVDLRVVDKLADVAVSPENGGDGLPFSQACKATSNYRLGRYPEAIERARKVLNSCQLQAQAKAYAILAMADWQLGQLDQARTMLAKGNSLAPALSPAHDGDEPGESWLGWLFARISLDEADALIQPAAQNINNSNPP